MATNLAKSNHTAFLSKILLIVKCSKLNLRRKASDSHNASLSWLHRHPFPPVHPDQHELSNSNKALMFHVEGALLKSSSIFPYFMLVAFEAGGLLRALVLLLLYPLICLVGKDMGVKIMVFVSFVGIKAKSFRVGTAVLPKFFLEDVGHEGFDFLMGYGRRVGLSDLPKVMVDGFLRHYMGIEDVVGRELKVVCGHFVGLMEARKPCNAIFSEFFGKDKVRTDVFGFGCFNKSLDRQFFSLCKAVFLVSEAEKRTWHTLAREKYPKPLIFHDGRLAFKPTPLATLVMFTWIPFGLILFLIRFIIGVTFPYKLSIPIFSLIGMRGTLSKPKSFNPQRSTGGKSRGILYICNHKTLFDPVFASLAIVKPLTAVTYSLSKVSELLAPIKTVRLTRDRRRDDKIIQDLLSQGDLVLCPEGTTCREPYLLRFSPLFAEVSDEIVPMAIDMKVSMLYATTASGRKSLDPVLLLMNPFVTCTFKILDRLPESLTCGGGGKSKFDVANHVQAQIGKALKFECTSLTRKDKYMLLASNEGTI